MERARELGFMWAMTVNMNMRDAVFDELCKADPAHSVLVLPPAGDLWQRLCATDRSQLTEFASDLYRNINRSKVLRAVSKLSHSTLYSPVWARGNISFSIFYFFPFLIRLVYFLALPSLPILPE